MSDGNGAKEAVLETACPVDPRVRPGECVSIHAQLGAIVDTQQHQGRVIAKLGKSLQRESEATRVVLSEVVDQLKKLQAAHGMKGRKGR